MHLLGSRLTGVPFHERAGTASTSFRSRAATPMSLTIAKFSQRWAALSSWRGNPHQTHSGAAGTALGGAANDRNYGGALNGPGDRKLGLGRAALHPKQCSTRAVFTEPASADRGPRAKQRSSGYDGVEAPSDRSPADSA